VESKTKYNLQRTMIIYFLLIATASVLVGVEFVVETNGEALKQALLQNADRYAAGEITATQLLAPIGHLRNKAVLMIGIILFVTVIVLTMFIKNITEPLQHMIERAREISRGDLSQTIRIRSDNELSELGTVINETTSNLQEIILLSRSICNTGAAFVTTADRLLRQREITPGVIGEITAEIETLHTELSLMAEVIDYFNFYTVNPQNDA
jgi:methyl-accepting chemotaxis protein